MSKRYNVLQAIFMPFYSKDFYRDVGQNWRGTGFGFLFFLLLICWVPLTYFFVDEIGHVINHEVVPSIEKMPNITIAQGELSIDAPQPYVLNDQDQKGPTIIIDTTGKYNDLSQTPAQILVTKNSVFVRQGNEVKNITFNKNLNMQLTQEDVKTWAKKSASMAGFILFPTFFILSYIYRIVQAIIYAAIGCLIIDLFVRSKLPYKAVLRLCIAAVTPVIVLSTIFYLLNVQYPFQLLSYFVLTMIYLIFGMSVNKNQLPAR